MERLYLPGCDVPTNATDFHGDVTSLATPQGIEFSRVRAAPHTLTGRSPDQPFALWLSILMEGHFSMQQQGKPLPVQTGDIVFGPTGVDATLAMQSDVQMLYVKIPGDLLNPRLLNPRSLDLGYLPGAEGVNRVFSNMLISVSENIDHMDSMLLQPIEIALAEFVVASLAPKTLVERFGSMGKVVHYQRICQAIDKQLGDPDLTLQKVADEQNVSARYVQKLFEAAGTSFGQYMKLRRLERCRCELRNPRHHQLSISDICFRWGFNDAAHFSRSFRSEFGMTPRACRQQALRACQ
jgi:AraC-like DNA-binding protein